MSDKPEIKETENRFAVAARARKNNLKQQNANETAESVSETTAVKEEVQMKTPSNTSSTASEITAEEMEEMAEVAPEEVIEKAKPKSSAKSTKGKPKVKVEQSNFVGAYFDQLNSSVVETKSARIPLCITPTTKRKLDFLAKNKVIKNTNDFLNHLIDGALAEIFNDEMQSEFEKYVTGKGK